MVDWAHKLSGFGTVTRFDYPYMAAGKGRPDRMPVLLAAHRDALHELPGDGPVVLIGKSMGSRMGCHVSLDERIAAVVCLGYPLAAMGNPSKLRDEVLLSMNTPVLFVQGTRDRLCPLGLLEDVRGRMTAVHALHIVETGDHSLQITKTHTKQTGVTQAHSDAAAIAAIGAFLGSHAV